MANTITSQGIETPVCTWSRKGYSVIDSSSDGLPKRRSGQRFPEVPPPPRLTALSQAREQNLGLHPREGSSPQVVKRDEWAAERGKVELCTLFILYVNYLVAYHDL